jgi:peptidoglycan biosynthesis protein MviN/MurJ (putative lipid II flippase)
LKRIWEYLESFVVIALVIAGISGVLYNLFREDGWLGLVLSKYWEFQFTNPVLAIAIVIIVILLAVWWRDRRVAKGQISRIPAIFLYALMALGAYFIGHYAIHGTL